MTDDLKTAFEQRWSMHINANSSYKCTVWTPFWHLGYESFWNFEPQKGVSLDFIKTLAEGHTASIGKMKQYIQYAKLDEELFNLFHKPDSRDILNNTLLATWLSHE